MLLTRIRGRRPSLFTNRSILFLISIGDLILEIILTRQVVCLSLAWYQHTYRTNSLESQQNNKRVSDYGSSYLFKSELNVKPNSKHAKRHLSIDK
jgi:hypothetical protein